MTDAVWVSDSEVLGTFTGNSQTGIRINNGACYGSPYVVLKMTFSAMGTTPSCCCYFIYGYQTSPSWQVEAMDCDGQAYQVGGGYSFVNLGICSCTLGDGPEFCINGRVPVEGASWGEIKNIYRSGD